MYNDLFTVFGFTAHGYGLMIGLGVVAGLMLAWKRARARSLSEDFATTIALVATVTGFAGGKVFYVLTHMRLFLADPIRQLGSSGFVVYGGILFGTLFTWLTIRRSRQSFLEWADVIFPCVSLAQSFGRLGCFMAGCCYGRVTDSFIGVTFPAGSMAPAGVPLIPTQLISAAGNLLICLALLRADKKEHPTGMLLVLYLVLYGVGRFFIEFLRNDYRGSVGIFSASQFFSFFALGAAAVLWRWLRRHREAA